MTHTKHTDTCKCVPFNQDILDTSDCKLHHVSTKHTDSVEEFDIPTYAESFHSRLSQVWGDKQATRNEIELTFESILTTLQATQSQRVEEAVRKEREIWAQRVPEDTFSVTIEGRFGKRILANRKFVTMKSITASDGRTLLLEAEACAHQMLQAIVTPNHQD